MTARETVGEPTSPVSHQAADLDEPESPAAPSSARVAAAGLWGLGGRVTLLLANLATIPLLIRLLGASSYGLWTLLQTGVTWAALADLGMASASTKYGSERYAHGDSRGEAAVVWSAATITGALTSLVAAVIAIEAPFVLGHLVHLRAGLLGSGTTALRLMCAMFVAQALAGTLNTPQQVRLRWKEYTLINSGTQLLASVGAPAALLLASGGVVAVAAVGLVTAAAGAAGNALLAISLQPAARRPLPDRAVMGQLVRYGGALSLSGLASIPLITAQKLFLAGNHSPTVLGYYSVAATLGTVLYFLPSQLVQPLLPGLTQLEARGQLDEHAALYRKCLSGLFLTMTPVAIVLALCARPFLALWAGPAYGAHSTWPTLIVVVGAWANSLAWVPTSYLLSSGRTKTIAYIQLAEVLPYLAAAWFLTDALGAIGAAVAFSLRIVVQAIVTFLAVRRAAPRLTISPLSSRRSLSLGAPVVLGLVALLASATTHGLAARSAACGAMGLAYAATAWRYVLTGPERRGLRDLLVQITPSKGGLILRRLPV